jgi:hypothetical protein
MESGHEADIADGSERPIASFPNTIYCIAKGSLDHFVGAGEHHGLSARISKKPKTFGDVAE